MAKFKKAADIRVGVVGYGGAFNMGKWHFQEMQKAGMTPVAVADPDKTRQEAAAKDFPGLQTYSSLGEMLKKSDVNFVTIITPHNTHAKLALEALKSGRSVVCEKPLAIKTAECDAMIAAAKKSGAILSTYHNRHWDGPIMAAVKQVGSGKIGKIVRIEARMGGYGKPGDWWRTSKTISGGILYDWGVHLLEYSLQLLGDDDLVEVSGFSHTGFWAGQTKWKNDCNEDHGHAVVRMSSGAHLMLTISQIESCPKRGFLEVMGTKGTLLMDWGANEITTHDGGTVITSRIPNPSAESWQFYQNIADHLVKGAKLVITGEWARRPIHILDLADQSARLGKAISAKYQ